MNNAALYLNKNSVMHYVMCLVAEGVKPFRVRRFYNQASEWALGGCAVFVPVGCPFEAIVFADERGHSSWRPIRRISTLLTYFGNWSEWKYWCMYCPGAPAWPETEDGLFSSDNDLSDFFSDDMGVDTDEDFGEQGEQGHVMTCVLGTSLLPIAFGLGFFQLGLKLCFGRRSWSFGLSPLSSWFRPVCACVQINPFAFPYYLCLLASYFASLR